MRISLRRGKREQQAEPADLDCLGQQIDSIEVMLEDQAADEDTPDGPGLVEDRSEIGGLVEGLHASQTGIVQRFEHAQGGEEELSTATRRVENGQVPQGVPEGAEQDRIAVLQ